MLRRAGVITRLSQQRHGYTQTHNRTKREGLYTFRIDPSCGMVVVYRPVETFFTLLAGYRDRL